ncbi:MAG: PKD domain-containing protein [Candidatus Hydrogenedentes bacterium]|nr:PKD domain-containing protein [Candidatus Hydrogenedentota bacterium]
MYFRSVTSFAAFAVLLSLTTFGCSNGGTVAQSSEATLLPPPASNPPTSAFSALPVAGNAPFDVQFTNQSDLGGEVFAHYEWIFGDGATSFEKSPLHTYQLPGVYAVTLTVRTDAGTATENKTDLVTVLPSGSLPLPDFSADSTSDGVPLEVQFRDESTLDPDHTFVLYAWDFGDGQTSSERHPIHTYPIVGNYTVSLTVATAGGANVETKTNFIRALVFVPPPSADFSAGQQVGKPPLDVQFTNLSSLNGAESATYLWDFGDGATSTEQHPFHQYDTIGRFTVSLTTTTRGGEDIETKADFINADLLPPIANFTGSPRRIVPGNTVNFTNLSSLDDALNPSFVWDFGDGAFSAVRDPVHAYRDEGLYTVKLTVTTLAGTDIKERVDFINVRFPAPIADFSATPISGAPPLQVTFTNTSDLRGAPDATYVWDFGDMTPFSTEQNPVHEYMDNGLYTVSLTLTTVATFPQSDFETKLDLILVGQSMNYILTFEDNIETSVLFTHDVSVIISSEVATNGKISIPGLGVLQSFSIVPGIAEEITIPISAIIEGSDITTANGIEITADDPISVYGMNRVSNGNGGSTDGFLAIPIGALGTEYFVLTTNGSQASQFAIVANRDNTQIQITPTATTGIRAAGVPYTIFLDKLEVYQLQTDSFPEDLTGTHILSDKPVAVFSGNKCAPVPADLFTSCDFTVEQLPPTTLWGTEFITVPLATRMGGDTFRILASKNNTIVDLHDGSPLIMLNEGEFEDRILVGAHEITTEANTPILVAQFAHNQEFDDEAGDPFMMLVMPAERFLSTYTFATPRPNPDLQDFSDINFVNIISTDRLVVLDDVLIEPDLFTSIPGTVFSAVQIQIVPGSHTVKSATPGQPIGLYIYGFAGLESYGFPGGMAF